MTVTRTWARVSVATLLIWAIIDWGGGCDDIAPTHRNETVTVR